LRRHYDDPRSDDAFHDGWFLTGDVVNVDADGFMQITDRAKDVIKSGGEWISSVELENTIMGHPDVLEAAVIGLPHDRWQERPLACVVPRPGEPHRGGDPRPRLRRHGGLETSRSSTRYPRRASARSRREPATSSITAGRALSDAPE
jgi:acyl-CoA synthetase (AMP-forming)/AMP-acid ligase II